MAHRTETVRVGGTPVQVLRGGSGRPVVVLHGIEGPEGWLAFHEALARDGDVWAPSHPGYGETPRPDWMESITHTAQFYGWFLQEAGLGDSLKVAQKPYSTVTNVRSSGLGWEVDFPGQPAEGIWKNGGDTGATSELWFSRGLNYGYVVLTNRGLLVQNGLPAGPAPASAIGTELRRILTAAARA
jgi:hypothetical protein